MKIEIIEFDLDKYNTGKYKVLMYKEGKYLSANIIYTKRKDDDGQLPIVVLYDNDDKISLCSKNGQVYGYNSLGKLYLTKTVFEFGDIITAGAGILFIFNTYVDEDKFNFLYCIDINKKVLHTSKTVYVSNCYLAKESEQLEVRNILNFKLKSHNFDDISSETKILAPPKSLEPFEHVLVRDNLNDYWKPSIYLYKHATSLYRCVDCFYKYAIPYKGNEELLGTNRNI